MFMNKFARREEFVWITAILGFGSLAIYGLYSAEYWDQPAKTKIPSRMHLNINRNSGQDLIQNKERHGKLLFRRGHPMLPGRAGFFCFLAGTVKTIPGILLEIVV